MQAALDRATLERDLSLTYLERLDVSGRVVAFVADPRASAIGDGFVRGLASTLSLSKPLGDRTFSRTWSASEPVSEGVRSSAYALAFWLDSPATVPTARFVRHASIASPPGDPHVVAPHVFAKCFDQGLLRTDGVLAHMLATESRGVRIGDRRIASSLSSIDATLIAIAPATVTPETSRLATRLATAGGLYVAQSSDDLRAHAYRDAAAKTTFAELARRLAAASAGAHDSAELSAAFAAQFFTRDASVAAVAPLLVRAAAGSRAFETLKLGLQDAGTTAAQALLARTMLARASDPVSGELAAALARVPHPNAKSIAALELLARRNPARGEVVALSLGTAARALGSRDARLANAIVDRLTAELTRARTPSERRVLLLALGNAGSTRAVSAIVVATNDSASDIRAAAALALRAVPGAIADDALLRLLRDRSDIVRLDAATAYIDRDIDPRDIDALDATLRDDTNRDVRAAVIEVVTGAYDRFPAAASLLASRAKSDRDPSVRAKASAALRHIDAIRNAEAL